MSKCVVKVVSLLLTLTMLLGLTCVPVNAALVAEGRGDGVIYLSTKVTDKFSNGTEISSVEENEEFWVAVNFANNPTTGEESINSFDLFLKYDNQKMKALNTTGVLVKPTENSEYSADTVKIAWATANKDGITKVDDDGNNVVQSSGTLVSIKFKALKKLAEADLTKFIFDAGTGSDTAGMRDANSNLFTVLQVPAITVALKPDVGTIYDTTTADELEAKLDVNYIDTQGKATPVTNFNVVLPANGLAAGQNQITVSAPASGLSETLTVSATADTVTNIAVTTQPKLSYTSGEKLDLSGMVVTATCASGKTKQVTDYSTAIGDTEVGSETVLKVADHNGKTITVT